MTRLPDFIILPHDAAPTWPQLLDAYRQLVAEVEDGYTGCLAEYANDLASRTALQERLDAGVAAPTAALIEELRTLDAPLRALLVPSPAPIHGRPPAHHFWFHGTPRTAPQVLADVRGAAPLP